MFVLLSRSASNGRVCYVRSYSRIARRPAAERHIHLLDALRPLAALRSSTVADLRGSASG